MAPIIELSNEALENLNPEEYTRRFDLEKSATTTQPSETQEVTTVNYNQDPSNYILVPGISGGKEKRPDLLVCISRLGMSPEVEQAGRQLGLTLENTARETTSGNQYLGNINREQAIRLNLLLGGITADNRLAADFLRLVFSGKAVDGNGKNINYSRLSQIADEITGVRAPYRGEWTEDFYKQGEKGLVLEKHYALKEGVLVPKYSHGLTTCLMEDRTPGIDLKDWLEHPTAKGLPKKNVKSGTLWYWHPRANNASWFFAFPGFAVFVCCWVPLFSCPWLGVRHVREARNFSKK